MKTVYVILKRRTATLLVLCAYATREAAKADAQLIGFDSDQITVAPLEIKGE